jgi:hypothetical protein
MDGGFCLRLANVREKQMSDTYLYQHPSARLRLIEQGFVKAESLPDSFQWGYNRKEQLATGAEEKWCWSDWDNSDQWVGNNLGMDLRFYT